MTTATNKATVKKTVAKTDKRPTMASLCKDLPTTSAKIRALDAAGYTRSEIAKHLEKRYQHVRNVLVTPLKGDSK